MRTISALVAGPLCALALSGAALAAERVQSRLQAPTPYWLELRTEVAAENSWPKAKISKTKIGRPTLATRQTTNGPLPAALADTARAALGQGLDVLRDWSKAAERLTRQQASFEVAEH